MFSQEMSNGSVSVSPTRKRTIKTRKSLRYGNQKNYNNENVMENNQRMNSNEKYNYASSNWTSRKSKRPATKSQLPGFMLSDSMDKSNMNDYGVNSKLNACASSGL